MDDMQRLVHGMGPNNPVDQMNDEPHGLEIGLAVGVALDALMAIVKVGILLFLKMFLLPIVLGIALDASTFSVLGNTLDARIAYAGKDLFSFYAHALGCWHYIHASGHRLGASVARGCTSRLAGASDPTTGTTTGSTRQFDA